MLQKKAMAQLCKKFTSDIKIQPLFRPLQEVSRHSIHNVIISSPPPSPILHLPSIQLPSYPGAVHEFDYLRLHTRSCAAMSALIPTARAFVFKLKVATTTATSPLFRWQPSCLRHMSSNDPQCCADEKARRRVSVATLRS